MSTSSRLTTVVLVVAMSNLGPFLGSGVAFAQPLAGGASPRWLGPSLSAFGFHSLEDILEHLPSHALVDVSAQPFRWFHLHEGRDEVFAGTAYYLIESEDRELVYFVIARPPHRIYQAIGPLSREMVTPPSR
jgi:hypothetical protein